MQSSDQQGSVLSMYAFSATIFHFIQSVWFHLLCPPFTSEYTEIYSTPLPAQPKPLDWWSESWENDKWPAPNFHIPRMMAHRDKSRLLQSHHGILQDCSHSFSIPSGFDSWFLSWLELLHPLACFFFSPYSMWVLSSLTRDWTCTPCIGSMES